MQDSQLKRARTHKALASGFGQLKGLANCLCQIIAFTQYCPFCAVTMTLFHNNVPTLMLSHTHTDGDKARA